MENEPISPHAVAMWNLNFQLHSQVSNTKTQHEQEYLIITAEIEQEVSPIGKCLRPTSSAFRGTSCGTITYLYSYLR